MSDFIQLTPSTSYYSDSDEEEKPRPSEYSDDTSNECPEEDFDVEEDRELLEGGGGDEEDDDEGNDEDDEPPRHKRMSFRTMAENEMKFALNPCNTPPPKPWERAGSSSGPAPFRPPSAGTTSDVVEASGTAKPGEIVSSAERTAPVNGTALSRPVPARPWEQNYGSTYGGAAAGYGSGVNNYNSGYGSGMYGSSYGGVGGSYGGMGGSYGGLGGSYGGGMYGNSMYRGGYGGLSGGSGMYGGGMYNGGIGGPMGGYGMGVGGGQYGEQDPNNPYGAPPSPPGFWTSFLRVMQGVVTIFGRISILIDQNTQALHIFMSALLQLFDRSGLLYGELARFVLRLLGIKTKPRKVQPGGPDGQHGPHITHGGQNYIEGPKAAPNGSWDNVWGNDPTKGM
ncbi:hypothetical protein GIB67_008380 [Kingdonia uniflora]|uniref:Peroxin-13 n=1 Tax=Kingdonia uniflora TaxID=39325 RepID=A0A7J7N4Y0_9MAGN|nr:hypothetical protein GIB67_008380 [Kingdonia uniflora]